MIWYKFLIFKSSLLICGVGVSASYAMQADVRIAVSEPPTKSNSGTTGSIEPRIGFAGLCVWYYNFKF